MKTINVERVYWNTNKQLRARKNNTILECFILHPEDDIEKLEASGLVKAVHPLSKFDSNTYLVKIK